MFFFKMKKIFTSSICIRPVITTLLPGRCVHVASYTLAKKEEAEIETFNILEELKPPELSEEEIELKRNKHRLPERLYRSFVKKEALPLETEIDFQQHRLRSYYARYGKASGLNPGILWPTRKELDEILEYDEVFHRPLQEMQKKIETERLEKETQKRIVEADIDSKMANLDQWIAEFHNKKEKKKEEALQLKKKREDLIEEISEFLGYDIDPKDPRFQEAVEQKEKEKKKAAKARKQQESYDRMLAKLKKMAEQ